MSSRDRRISLRMPLFSKAICCTENNGDKLIGTLRNINTFGVFVEVTNCPATWSQCEITIVVEGDHSHLTIDNLKGKIIRIDQDGIAVLFDQNFEWLPLIPLLNSKIITQQRLEANRLNFEQLLSGDRE